MTTLTLNPTGSTPSGSPRNGAQHPAPHPRPSTPAAVGHTLRPLLASRRDAPPRDLVRDCVLAGLSAGHTAASIRRWLHASDPERFATWTATERAMRPLVRSARTRMKAINSDAWRLSEADHVAQRLVGYLLAPARPLDSAPRPVLDKAIGQMVLVPPRRLSTRAEINGRHATAIVGLHLIDNVQERGWDNLLVSTPWLAVAMGCSENTAAKALRDAVAVGWLRRHSTRPGSAARYDLGTRTARWPDGAREAADTHVLASAALTLREPSANPVAELVALADHPAISYGLGARAWLVAVAREAGVDSAALGVSKRHARTEWQSWLGALTADGSSVRADLDLRAQSSGASARKAEAEDARRARAADRVAALEAVRARRAHISEWLTATLRRCPLPSPNDAREKRNSWGAAMIAAVGSAQVPDTYLRDLARDLTTRMRRRGYEQVLADRVARQIAGLKTTTEAAA